MGGLIANQRSLPDNLGRNGLQGIIQGVLYRIKILEETKNILHTHRFRAEITQINNNINSIIIHIHVIYNIYIHMI